MANGKINRKDLNAYLNSDRPPSSGPTINKDNLNSLLTNVPEPTDFISGGASGILNYGEDISNRDYLDDSYSFLSGYDTDELRANRQPWAAKAGSGVGRFGAKVIAEIAKMPGVLGGIVAGGVGQIGDAISGEDNTDFIQTAFNNPWIETINQMEEGLKENVLPVYIEKAVKEGNLWDNITAIDFWATEGADGLGYIVSMLAPGALINKANLGAKLLKGATKYQRMLGKTEEAAQKLTKLGITPKNVNLHSATVANTLFEAGAEAKSAMDSYIDGLNRRRLLHPQDEEYITEEEYNNLVEKQSEVGRNVFLANIGILIGPNAVMSKILWGNKLNATSVKKVDGAFEQLSKLTTKQKILKGAKAFGQGTMREGFFEEGMQSVAEEYFTEHPDATAGDFIGALPEAYADMISTTDGQKAIFLGAVFGGGMSAYQTVKNEEAKIKSANSLINGANAILKDFDSFFDTDAKINDSEEQVIEGTEQAIDPKKAADKLSGLDALERLGEQYDTAVENGDTQTINNIRELMTTQLIKPFIVNEHLGLDALRQHLQDSKSIVKQAEKEDFDLNTYVNDIMDKAEYLKKEYEVFNNFGDTLIELTNEDATKNDKVAFFNQQAMSYVNNKSLQRYFGNKLSKVDKDIDSVYAEYEDELVKKSFNEDAQKNLIKNDARLPKLLEAQKELKALVKETIKIDKDAWNTEKLNKKFNAEMKQATKIRKAAEEKAQIDDLFKSIREAKNEKELDAITIPETEAGKIAKAEIQKEIDSKKKEFMTEKQLKQAEKKQKAAEQKLKKEQEIASTEEAMQELKDKFNEGETIALPNDVIPKNKLNKDVDSGYEIVKFHAKSITLKNDKGQSFAISGIPVNEKATFLETQDSTEGGETDTKEFYSENKPSGKIAQEYDARLLSQNDKKGEENEVLRFTNAALMAFERNPVDKTGSYSIVINDFRNDKGTTGNAESDLALQMAFPKDKRKKGDFSDVELMTNYLPISIQLAEGIEAPLDTLRKGNKDIFEKSTQRLRSAIAHELKSGTKISDIKVDLVGQFNGELQLDGQNNNNVAGLYDYQEDVSNIKTTDIFVVDENGILKNHKGGVMSSNRPLAKGEIYIKVKTAAGNDFPLKLNVSQLGNEEADILYELVKYRFENRFDKDGKVNPDDNSEVTPLSELPQVLELLEGMPEVIALFKSDKRKPQDITVRELMHFFAYGSSNPKSRLRFAPTKPIFMAGAKMFNKNDIDNNPEAFKAHLTSFKRRHIKIKRSKYDSNNLNLTNKKYLDYLINNKVLSTNAVVGKNNYTFAGRTTMYVSPSSVTVKGKPSAFNQKATYQDNKNFVGTQEQLQEKLPGLFENKVQQNPDGKKYVNIDTGESYARVTSLKPGTIVEDVRMYNAAKRGTFIDDVLREYLSTPNMTLDDFMLYAETSLMKVNDERPDTELDFADDVIEELYNVFAQYRKLFNELNYTVYARETVVYGQIGAKGNIAGTMDILVYDNPNKKWRIIDLKSSSIDRREIYEQPGPGAFPYKKNDAIQQNAYRELFKQRTGEEADVHILPITLKPDDKETGDTYTFLPNIVAESENKSEELSEVEAKRQDLLLDVEKSSIYSILKINRKKKEPTKKETPKKKIVKNKKKDSGRVTTNPSFDLHEAVRDIIDDPNPYNVIVNKQGYTVTNPTLDGEGNVIGGFYILSQSDNRYVDTKKEALSIINAVIKDQGESGSFTKKNAEKIWNSREKVVSSQKTKKRKENTNKKTNKKAKTVDSPFRQILMEMKDVEEINNYKNIMVSLLEIDDLGILPERLDNQTEELDRLPTEKEEMLLVYDFLVERGISSQEIEDNCI